MTTAAEHSQIISNHNKFIRGKSKERAELARRVVNEYQIAIKPYNFNPSISQEEKIQKVIKDKYGLTERKLQNIIGNQNKFMNAKQEGFTSELVMRHYIRGIEATTEALDNLNEYIDYIETIPEGEFVDIEKYAGAKGGGIKGLSPREAIRSIYREKVDLINKSFEPLKALAPKVIQVQDTTPQFDTIEELEEQERILKEELKID